jgi:hypothetical protein
LEPVHEEGKKAWIMLNLDQLQAGFAAGKQQFDLLRKKYPFATMRLWEFFGGRTGSPLQRYGSPAI